jgi:hypothetical protein
MSKSCKREYSTKVNFKCIGFLKMGRASETLGTISSDSWDDWLLFLRGKAVMRYTTISPALLLTCSRTCPGLLPHFSHLSLENAGKTGRSVGEIFDESAMRSGAGRETTCFGSASA